jgi:hypothetical protein
MRHFITRKLLPGENVNFNDAFNRWAENAEWRAFSQFVVMGNYMSSQEPNEISDIYCHDRKDFASGALKLEDSNCTLYIPNAAHFGWGYNMYIHGGGGKSYRNGGNKSEKYGPEYLRGAEVMMHEGFCLMEFYSKGSIHDLCNGTVSMKVPIEIDLYHDLRVLPSELIRARFTQESSDSGLCRFRRRSSMKEATSDDVSKRVREGTAKPPDLAQRRKIKKKDKFYISSFLNGKRWT